MSRIRSNLERKFWEELGRLVQDFPQEEKILIRKDLNRLVGSETRQFRWTCAHIGFVLEI